MFLAKGPGSILGGPRIKQKWYLTEFFAAKTKKTLVIMSQK